MLVQSAPYPSSLPVTIGYFGGTANSGGLPVNWTYGSVYIAANSGALNTMHVKQGPTGRTGTFRLVVYSASSGTAVGSLLGYTADETGLSVGQTKSLPLLAPVSVVAGQRYFVGMQCGPGNPGCGAGSGGSVSGGRAFIDTFSDGPLATASTTEAAGGDFNVWATGG